MPYGLRFSVAKPIAGLLVFAWLAPRCQSLRELLMVVKSWSFWLLPAIVVLTLAWLLGVVIDIKWLWWTPVFIVFNALFTALPEEAFFRTLLQQPMHRRWGNAWWIIPLMAVLFALVHVLPTDPEAMRFFAVFFIAGTAYAWSFSRTRKIEAALLTHVAVNALHFIFLTYPMAFSA